MCSDPKISIIVAVYNVEKYLPECLDSILTQTFTDFELLLIDDGSPDTSGKICDEYAEKDNRIKVFHKENGGVSRARNLGLDNANGKWITFVDSDDWIENTYLQHLMEDDDEDVELILEGRKLRNEKSEILEYMYMMPSKNEKFTKNNFGGFYEKYLHSWYCRSACGKLFLLKNIKKYNIKFNEELSYGEDSIFFLVYLRNINSFSINKYDEYNYIKRKKEYSLSKTNFIEGKEKFYKILQNEYQYIIDSYKLSPKILTRQIFIEYRASLFNLYRGKNQNRKERLKQISYIFRKLKDYGYNYSEIVERKREKVVVWLYKINNLFLADLVLRILFIRHEMVDKLKENKNK